MKLLITIIFVSFIANQSIAKNYFTSPKKPSAKIILESQKSTESLSSVKLVNVNGKEVIPRSNAVWLKPGEYNLKFMALIENNDVNSGSNRLKYKNKSSNNFLNITLEEGKTYYVAYDSKDLDIKKWRPVVWKIE
jgi:hypothetical protein